MIANDLCILCIARNEENSISLVINDLRAITDRFKDIEVVLISDGSTDNTLAIMQREIVGWPTTQIKIINNTKPIGRRLSLLALMSTDDAVKSPNLMVIGGHYQDRLSAIEIMVSQVKTADIIIAYLSPDNRSMYRVAISKLYTSIINKLTGNNIKYYNGISIYPKKFIQLCNTSSDISYQAEIILYSLKSGSSYVQVGVPCVPRIHGKSKTFRIRNIKSALYFFYKIIIK
jgi:glycosyltransferase involved in cell wall biosynthesis